MRSLCHRNVSIAQKICDILDISRNPSQIISVGFDLEESFRSHKNNVFKLHVCAMALDVTM